MKYFLALLLISTTWASPSPQRIEIRVEPTEESAINDSENEEIGAEPLTDNEAEAVSAAVSAVLRTILSPSEKASTVRGRCTYRGGFCPGALVELKTSKGQLVASQSLASSDGFAFANLKPGRYLLEVSYARYNLRPVSKLVSPGSDVTVEMIE